LTEGSFTVDPQDGATRLNADGNEVAIESVTLGLASAPAERNNVWDTREGSSKVAGPATAGAAAPTNGNTSRIGTGDGADVIDGLISNGSADDQMVNAPFGLNITGPRH
jgi:hypothetical protein